MLRIKVMLIVSSAVAAVFWGLSAAALKVRSLQCEGTPSFIAVVAVTSTVAFIVLLMHRCREKRTDERLRQIEEEYRRREAALVRREAALIKTIRLLADGPTTGPQPRLRAVGGERL